MPRERRIFKLPHKKQEPLPEPKPQTKSKPKAKKESSSHHTQEEKQEFAEQLKQNPRKSELVICDKLNKQKIEFQFREIVHGYIPSFYFPQYKKIIELDGKQHRDKEKEARRDKIFKEPGIKILHIKQERVFSETDWVMEEIISFLTGKPIPHRRKKSKKKTYDAKLKKPEDYLHNPELTVEEFTERLKDSDVMDKTLDDIEKRKWYY
jgi:very-short-patch-repair endonuclease